MIGIMYCVACFTFFFTGGLLALLMRAELAAPGLQFFSNEQYNQLFTSDMTLKQSDPLEVSAAKSYPRPSPSSDLTATAQRPACRCNSGRNGPSAPTLTQTHAVPTAARISCALYAGP